MKKIEKYFQIDYNECDNDYIEELVKKINNKFEELFKFFNLETIDTIYFYIWDDIEAFRNKIIYYNDQTVGHAYHNRIDILTYEKRIQLRPQDNFDTYLMTFLHELVHIFHIKLKGKSKSNWFAEGLACYLGSPRYEYTKVDCDIDLIINKKAKYKYYYSMVKYLIENYPHEEVLKYVVDDEYVLKNTNKIINELNENIKKLERK